MEPYLLLAQDSTVETAGKTVTVLERLIAGGVPLICLGVAVIFGLACFYLYRQNQRLQRDQLKREADVQKERLERERDAQAERAALEKDYREKVEALLREMLDRGEDAQEVITSNTAMGQDMTQSLQQLTTRIEYVERTLARGPGA